MAVSQNALVIAALDYSITIVVRNNKIVLFHHNSPITQSYFAHPTDHVIKVSYCTFPAVCAWQWPDSCSGIWHWQGIANEMRAHFWKKGAHHRDQLFGQKLTWPVIYLIIVVHFVEYFTNYWYRQYWAIPVAPVSRRRTLIYSNNISLYVFGIFTTHKYAFSFLPEVSFGLGELL